MLLKHDLVEYGLVNSFGLDGLIRSLPNSYWLKQTEDRKKLAGSRPGNATYLFNESPAFVPRRNLLERLTRDGYLDVRVYKEDPLFNSVNLILNDCINHFFPNGSIMRVQVAELPIGKIIKKHRDSGILTKIHRLHIPLITKKGVNFHINDSTYFLEKDHLYDLNNVVFHSVSNDSDIDRYHLLLDLLPNEEGLIRYHFTDEDFRLATSS